MAEYVAAQKTGLVQSHKGYNPRIIFFYFAITLALMVLVGGLGYRQLLRSDLYQEKEKNQSQRRILIPGPRGNLYDRDGRLLVGNRPRFAAVIYLDELRPEFRREYINVRKTYREIGDADLPNVAQMSILARHAVVTRYLNRINAALGRHEEVDAKALDKHFLSQPQIPYTLIADLHPEEYARLLEQLPVNSPLQVYTSSTRYYPYGPAAAHALGYVSSTNEIDLAKDFPGADLMTFQMKGSGGRNGLEAQFDDELQGEAGGSIYRVDPAGVRVESLEKRRPVQGKNLATSLDIDLQLAAEKQMKLYEMAGAAVAMDVNTGEVLVMASLPSYDLNDFSPHLSTTVAHDINERGAWLNRATQGLYPPGSTFKIITSIAALRAGVVEPDEPIINCNGVFYRYSHRFVCYNGRGHHGDVLMPTAIAQSCDIYFYEAGWRTTPEVLAAEARRFGLGSPTGIELPHESTSSLVPDPAWKMERRGLRWMPGDTANYAIGQGDLLVTPLQMAAFAASVARGQTRTTPYVLHDPERPTQRTESIGLSAKGYAAVLEGMEEVTVSGTAKTAFTTIPIQRIPGLRVAGKTGTAQKRTAEGTINFAWFICFAPIERPQVAIAVMIEGDTPGEETGGGSFSAPVAHDILKAWAEKHPDLLPPPPPATPPAKVALR